MLGGIGHVRRGQLQTRGLPAELLQLLLLQPPPPAVQVEDEPPPRTRVEAHQDAVVARRPREGGVDVLACEGEAAALQGDVHGDVVALVVLAHGARHGDAGLVDAEAG